MENLNEKNFYEILNLNDKNFYEILKVDDNATKLKIKRSYNKLIKQCEDEKLNNPSSEETKKLEMEERALKKAFEVLMNGAKKTEYDKNPISWTDYDSEWIEQHTKSKKEKKTEEGQGPPLEEKVAGSDEGVGIRRLFGEPSTNSSSSLFGSKSTILLGSAFILFIILLVVFLVYNKLKKRR